MYKPSENMPLNSFQVVSPCENQTDFRAGQVIRFIIPRSIGFWDPHTSRLQLEVQTANNNFKMCYAHDCGVASLIDMVRISQNGIVLSETTEYATLNNLFTLYSDSLSVKQRNSTQNGARDFVVGETLLNGLVDRTTTSGAVLGECLNSDGTGLGDNMDRTPKKYQLELRGIGLFELMNVVPSIALGDLLIEIRLVNQNRQALKIHPATAVAFPITAVVANATTLTMTPAFKGFNNLADSPLVVGMNIKFSDPDGVGTAAAEKAITGLSQDDVTGVITATFAPAVAAAGGGNTDIGMVNFIITGGSIVGGVASSPNLIQTTAFVVNRASLLLQVIRPPQQYIEEIAAKVQEGMMIDLNTYTTYRATVQGNIKNVTIDIPAMMSRARAVFSVPRLQDNNEFGAAYIGTNAGANANGANNILGQYAQLLRYRTQIGELYYPNQPVGLQQFIKRNQTHFSAQHIVELEKALNAAQIPLRSLNSTKQNFVIPRVLAKYGASMNLDKGIRLYLEYHANGAEDKAGAAVNLDVVTFVNHINRVMVTANGLEVLS